jgi:hypothetical protein
LASTIEVGCDLSEIREADINACGFPWSVAWEEFGLVSTGCGDGEEQEQGCSSAKNTDSAVTNSNLAGAVESGKVTIARM